MAWFLYDGDLRHEKEKKFENQSISTFMKLVKNNGQQSIKNIGSFENLPWIALLAISIIIIIMSSCRE